MIITGGHGLEVLEFRWSAVSFPGSEQVSQLDVREADGEWRGVLGLFRDEEGMFYVKRFNLIGTLEEYFRIEDVERLSGNGVWPLIEVER